MGVSVGHAVRDCGGAAAKDRTADTSRFAVSYSYGVARNEAPRSPILLRIRPECPSPAGDFAPGFVLLHPDDPPPMARIDPDGASWFVLPLSAWTCGRRRVLQSAIRRALVNGGIDVSAAATGRAAWTRPPRRPDSPPPPAPPGP
jgi:hypothetical protein